MDNKALVVTLVVVFIGGLVLGTASFGGLSGRAVGENPPSVTVTPRVISAGEQIDINVMPRPSADTVAYLYRQNEAGQYLRINEVEYCRGSGRSCTQARSYGYTVPQSWSAGTYCARVYVSQSAVPSGEFGQDCFTVV